MRSRCRLKDACALRMRTSLIGSWSALRGDGWLVVERLTRLVASEASESFLISWQLHGWEEVVLAGAGALPSFFSFTAHSPAETKYSLQCSQLHTTIKSDQHIPKTRTINNTTIINMFPSPLTSIPEQLTTSVNTSNHHLKTLEEGKKDQDSLSLSPSTKRGHDSDFVEMFGDGS